MSLQSLVAAGLISLCAIISMPIAHYRLSGYVGRLTANALVALTGILSLWFAPNSAAWLTGGMFLLLIVSPLVLLRQAVLATRNGKLEKAARLHRWAAYLHPSSQMQFWAALSQARNAAGPDGEAVALAQVEAQGSQRERTLARLLLAHEQRDWKRLLELARVGDLPIDISKPRELRALGELGYSDEMVRSYESARKSIPPHARPECLLFVLAFTGQVESVEQILGGSLSAADDDSKSYWRAVARLRKDHNDETAHAMLKALAESAIREGVRRSATQHLRRVDDQARSPLAEETQRAVEAIIQGPVQRARVQEERRQRARERRKIRRRALLWLILLSLVVGVIEGYWTFHHVARVR